MANEYEKFEATVADTDDPEKRGRIRVTCVGLIDDETVIPNWIEPAVQWGWFVVPDVDEIVQIEVVVGSTDDEEPGESSIGAVPEWSGARYYGDPDADNPAIINEMFTEKNYGKRRGFATPAGHVILFDDTEGDALMSFVQRHGTKKDPKYTSFSIDKDGSLVANTSGKHLLYMNNKPDSQEFMVIDPNGNTFTSKGDAIRMISKDGTYFEGKGKDATVVAKNEVTIVAKTVGLGVLDIPLASREKSLLGETFLDLFAKHIHPTGMGPSGPPQVGAAGVTTPWESALTEKVKHAK